MKSKIYKTALDSRLKYLALSLALMLAMLCSASAEVLHPFESGRKWEDPSTWVNASGDQVMRLPDAQDQIVIPSGITLHVNEKPENNTSLDGLHTWVKLLTIEAGGNLTIDGNAAIVFENCAVIDLKDISSTLTFANSKKSYIAISGIKVLPEGSTNQTGIQKITNTSIACKTPLTLPVKFLQDLTAKQIGNDVMLNWATAAQTDIISFEIQRSSDNAVNWKTIGKVIAGRNASGQPYHYTDTKSEGNNILYRLKVNSQDAQSSFTKAVALNFKSSVNISPNPTHGQVRLGFLNALAEKSTGRLLNAAGVLVKTFQIPAAATSYNLDLSDLQPGIYFVQVKTGSQIALSTKLILK